MRLVREPFQVQCRHTVSRLLQHYWEEWQFESNSEGVVDEVARGDVHAQSLDMLSGDFIIDSPIRGEEPGAEVETPSKADLAAEAETISETAGMIQPAEIESELISGPVAKTHPVEFAGTAPAFDVLGTQANQVPSQSQDPAQTASQTIVSVLSNIVAEATSAVPVAETKEAVDSVMVVKGKLENRWKIVTLSEAPAPVTDIAPMESENSMATSPTTAPSDQGLLESSMVESRAKLFEDA